MAILMYRAMIIAAVGYRIAVGPRLAVLYMYDAYPVLNEA